MLFRPGCTLHNPRWQAFVDSTTTCLGARCEAHDGTGNSTLPLASAGMLHSASVGMLRSTSKGMLHTSAARGAHRDTPSPCCLAPRQPWLHISRQQTLRSSAALLLTISAGHATCMAVHSSSPSRQAACLLSLLREAAPQAAPRQLWCHPRGTLPIYASCSRAMLAQRHVFSSQPCCGPRQPLGSMLRAPRHPLGSHAALHSAAMPSLHLGNPSKPLGSHTLTSLRKATSSSLSPLYIQMLACPFGTGFTHASQKLKNMNFHKK